MGCVSQSVRRTMVGTNTGGACLPRPHMLRLRRGSLADAPVCLPIAVALKALAAANFIFASGQTVATFAFQDAEGAHVGLGRATPEIRAVNFEWLEDDSDGQNRCSCIPLLTCS